MNKILISGSNGFVGSNLSEYLNSNGHYLLALDLQKHKKTTYNKSYTWEELPRIFSNEINTIIHLAGIAHDTNKTNHPEKYFEINVGLTKLIFDHFLKSDAKKFIFFSSVKAVADSVKNAILTEDDIPNPQTPYGQSKLAAENYILSQTVPPGKQIYILRPAMIHGPGNQGNLNLLYRMISKGIPYPLGAFSNKRSYTSIGNLNYIIEQLLQKDIDSGIYQIADSESLSTNEIITLIAKLSNQKSKIWKIPKSWIKITARLGDFLFLPFNSERLKKLTENYVVSNKKITDALAISLPISAREGLIATVESFQEKIAHTMK